MSYSILNGFNETQHEEELYTELFSSVHMHHIEFQEGLFSLTGLVSQMKPSTVGPCLHIQMELFANIWLFLDFYFVLEHFQADECKCNGWKTPIPPAKSPRVDVSQPLASFTDPCRSCTHVLGMECTFIAIYLSLNCML